MLGCLDQTTLLKLTGYSCQMTTEFKQNYSKPFCKDHQGLFKIPEVFLFTLSFFFPLLSFNSISWTRSQAFAMNAHTVAMLSIDTCDANQQSQSFFWKSNQFIYYIH